MLVSFRFILFQPWREVNKYCTGVGEVTGRRGNQPNDRASLAPSLHPFHTRSCRLYPALSFSALILSSVDNHQEPANLKRQSLRFPPVTHQWSGGHVTERNTLPVMEPVDGKPLGNPRFYKHDLLQVWCNSADGLVKQ